MKCEICQKDGAERVKLLFDDALIADKQVAELARLGFNKASLCERCRKLDYALKYVFGYLRLEKKVGHKRAIVFLNRAAALVAEYSDHVKPLDYRRIPALKRRLERYVQKATR